MSNMVVSAVGHVGIAVFTANAPSDQEWSKMLEVVKKADLSKFKGLSFSDGGAPNSAQRKAMNDLTQGYSIPSVVVTSSTVARGVVTAMSWFNPNMKAFHPDQLEDALHHLKVSESEFGLIRMALRRLAGELGGAARLACIPRNL